MTSIMTSSKSSECFGNGFENIQFEKESLAGRLSRLESALKEKTNELKLLCLKEAELTGQLPIDYPLQPREPIPQVRRRIARKLVDRNCIVPPPRHHRGQSAPHKSELVQQDYKQYFGITSTNMNILEPNRPTSTNSTSSSNSTASSHTRSTYTGSNQLASNNGGSLTSGSMLSSSSSASSTSSNGQTIPTTRFQPFVEETKPFQMSDYYKYSTKHRQKLIENDSNPTKFKTTRQLQEEAQRKNLSRFISCDEQLQNSRKIIEKSGQKLIEATAKAIASNPGLAEKLNNILPNYGDRY